MFVHWKALVSLGSLFVVLSLSGCASKGLLAEGPTITKRNWVKGVPDTTIVDKSNVASLFRTWIDAAKLSDAVYRDEIGSQGDRAKYGCNYVHAEDEYIKKAPLPYGWFRLNAKRLADLGLSSVSPTARQLKPCRSEKGLQYETYVKLSDTNKSITEVAIVFRGTENFKTEVWDDWLANITVFEMGLFDNEQFRIVRNDVGALVVALSSKLPAVDPNVHCKAGQQAPILLVGHSLGGALAQHLAMHSNPCHVLKTVTFDSSPATGFRYLEQHGLVGTNYPVIERVYVDKEVLSYVRKVSTTLIPSSEYRTDYEVSFPEFSGSIFHRHSISLLATALKTWASEPDPNIDIIKAARGLPLLPEEVAQK